MKIANTLSYCFWIVCLSACNPSNSNSAQQLGSSNPNYVARMQYDNMLNSKNQEIQTATLAIQNKDGEIIRLNKNIDRFIKENLQLRAQIQDDVWLLDLKNDKDRRELNSWGPTNWFWVYECSQWYLNDLGFPLCQFTEHEIEMAKKMVGKGYPLEPTSILLYMPFALGYLLLIGILFVVIFGLLLRALLRAFVQAYTEPSKALLYEINSKFRAEIDHQFKELYLPYEEAANREIAKTNIAKSEHIQLTEKSNQLRNKLNSQDKLALEKNRTLEDLEEQIFIVKNEYSKIVEHCVDQFINESYRREKYLNKLREFLTNPVSRQFQDFTGLAPTDETLRKIEAAEKKELEWEEMDEEEEH